MATKITSANTNSLVGCWSPIVRLSDGTIYVAFIDSTDNEVEMWKSANGTSWTQQDVSNSPADAYSVSIAVDSSDNIHVAYHEEEGGSNDNTVQYLVYNTTTDTFGTPEEAINFEQTGSIEYFVDIALDSNDKPHIVACFDVQSGKNTYLTFFYVNKVSGWSTEIELYGADASSQATAGGITVDGSDRPCIVWQTPSFDYVYALRATSNTPTVKGDFTNKQVVAGGGQANPNIAADGDGDIWISYDIDAMWYTAVKKQSSDWTSDWTVGSLGTDAVNNVENIALSCVGNHKHIIFYDYLADGVYYNRYDDTAWTGKVELQDGTYSSIRIKWSAHNDNQADIQLDYLFSDGTDIYWDKVILPKIKEITADGILKVVETVDITADAVLEVGVETYYVNSTADGILRGTETVDILADGLLEGEAYAEITADGILTSGGETYYSNITSDAILKAIGITTFLADGLLEGEFYAEILADAVLKAVGVTDITADGILQISNTVAFLADGLLEGEFYSEILADAVLKGTAVVEISADAYLVYTYTVGITSDGILLSIGTSAITADAILFAETLLYQLCIPSMSCEVLLSCDIEKVNVEDAIEPTEEWLSPVSHYDPDGKWDTEAYAYDDNTGTGASNYRAGSFLELNLLNEVLCDKVRVYVDDMNTINIDVFCDNAWVHVYSGSIAENQWVEKSLPDYPRVITKIRIACTYSMLGALYELEVYGHYHYGEMLAVITNEPLLTCEFERYICGS